MILTKISVDRTMRMEKGEDVVPKGEDLIGARASVDCWRDILAWITGGDGSRDDAMLRRRQSPTIGPSSEGAQNVRSLVR
jgi:hypothetical protein